MHNSLRRRIVKDFRKNKYLLIMMLPVLVYFLIFHYGPMYGALIAFKNYAPRLGLSGSPWVGFSNFQKFLTNYSFWNVFRNTITISLGSIVFGFPAPILLALLLNEVRHGFYKRTVQTITYMPHFISIMVICGILVDFCSSNGIITQAVSALTGTESRNLLTRPELFKTLYISSGIWQEIGFSSIIYLSALSRIDAELYEASSIDGANRWQQMRSITLPGLMATIIILFILRIGRLMGVGYEKILLLYNPSTYEAADVISTFVYRRGLLNMEYGFGSAVGLFNSLINMTMLITFNQISRKVADQGLW
ncbi:MAG: ABC transporter permease subunit [Oscillospiraceae bacterium]|nr:ABC transporter permease subunit [Oscillospiraceae bacterium]